MTAVIRMAVPALALAGLLAAPRLAAAQVNCGTTSVSHSMRQTPGYARSVDVSASTSRPINTCPLEVQTEAWVDSLSTAYINSSRQLYSASVSFTRAVPAYGTLALHGEALADLVRDRHVEQSREHVRPCAGRAGHVHLQAHGIRLRRRLRVQALVVCVRRPQSHPHRHGG